MDDALGDRVWVDLKSCKRLTDNILTLFNTRSIGGEGLSEQLEPAEITDFGNFTKLIETIPVQPRFSLSTCRTLHPYIVQLVREQIGKRGLQSSDLLLKNHVKFLIAASGMVELRLYVAEKFEHWIQNSKMLKPVHELLCTVAANSYKHTVEDIKVFETFLNAKLKIRLFSQNYITCIREFISVHHGNLNIMIRRIVSNELTQSVRQPTNIQLLTMACQQWPDETVKVLGIIFQDFLCRKEDYLRALRGFLRELVRRCENFPFTLFARSLMQQRTEPEFSQLEQFHKERIASSLADLISCCSMLTVTATIKEAYTSYGKGDKSSVTQLKPFFDTLGVIQRDSIWWVHSILRNFLRPQPTDYKTCLRKLLFLEPPESYSGKDSWPSENDRASILQMTSEGNVNGDTLMRILMIGLDGDLPLSPSDALDIADKLVARAANVHTSELPRVPALEKRELFDAIFDITTYRPPSSIALPKSYRPPNLAISKLYWKGWLLTLVLAAFNPKSIGSVAWNEYPTLQSMMTMVMTNNYTFAAALTKSQRELSSAREEKLALEEKEAILKYENYLAVSSSSTDTTVTEATSYLLNQVMLLDPKGPARRLPASAVELIKTVNGSLKLGQLLCQCRSPDFLLEIIQQQGTGQAMSWLRDLIDGSQSSLDVLPVPCLCEFLITSYQEKRSFGKVGPDFANTETDGTSHRTRFKTRQRSKVIYQHEQMIIRLQSLVFSSTSTTCLDVLQYFISKLTSPSSQWALKALQDILSSSKSPAANESMEQENEDVLVTSWLLQSIPSLSVFPEISSSLVTLILKASEIELDVHLFMAFVTFITSYTPQQDETLSSVALDLAVLISRRFSFFKKAYLNTINGLDIIAALLSMLHSTLDAHIYNGFRPPSLYEEEDLSILSLPSVSDDCEVVVVTGFINAVFLVLSLVPPTRSAVTQDLMSLLLPEDISKRAQLLAMATREMQQLVRSETLELILCNCNTELVKSLVSSLTTQQICRYLKLYGINKDVMDQLLWALDEAEFVSPRDAEGVVSLIRRQHLRGCVNGCAFLSRLRENKDYRPVTSNELLENPVKPVNDRSVPATAALQPKVAIDEALSCIFMPSSHSANYQQVLLLCLQLLKQPLFGEKENQVVEKLLKCVERLKSLRGEQLETVFKQHYVWRLLHLITRVAIKSFTSFKESYFQCLSSLKSHAPLMVKTNLTSQAIISSCVKLMAPTAFQIAPFASVASKGSPNKIVSHVMQSVQHLEENLLPFARYAIVNDQQQSFMEVLLKVKSKTASVRGLMCDLMEAVDPELITVSSLVQEYMFSCSDMSYLLETFLHQVSMTTLRTALLSALSSSNIDIDSSILLDLLWACLHSPTLWQGKVKKEAVIDSNLSLGIEDNHDLYLSTPQLFAVIDHVLKEMSAAQPVILTKRLPLLMTCSRNKLGIVASYLAKHSSKGVANQLLFLLYHGDANVGQYVSLNMASEFSSTSLPSRLDSYLHYLLIAMTTVSNNDLSIPKLTAASLLCRQIAITHPVLMLRQLPLLGWLLRGRVLLSTKQLQAHHQIVFNNTFQLLYLLQPAIFLKHVDLECCLESLMSYLKHQCLSASLSHSLLGKVLSFLYQYCQHSRDRAQRFLSNYCDTLQSLKDAYPKQRKVLQDILSTLPSKTVSNYDGHRNPSESSNSLFDGGTPSTSSHTHSYIQVLPFIRKLETGHTQEGMLEVLRDLEDSSLRSVEILDYFIPILCQIIQSADISCAKIAHEVILRHLRHNPSTLDKILPSVMACLNSPNFATVMATVPYLPELILLSPAEEASQLLSCLFQFAVVSPVNCGQELKRVVTLLTTFIAPV